MDDENNSEIIKSAGSSFFEERWFFYWRTSSSLWKFKLQQFEGQAPIFIPINWSFHTETGSDIDFGDKVPETDLVKLCQLAQEYEKNIIFLMPMTPAPFLPNGGVPHFIARNFAKNEFETVYCIVDQEGLLNKICTFFDTNVYKKYSYFVNSFSKYLNDNDLNIPVVGLNSFYYQNGIFKSFFIDNSLTFDESFSKFLKVQKSSLTDLKDEKKNENEIKKFSKEEEDKFRGEFFNTILDLYYTTAKESFAERWIGDLNYVFLGSNVQDLEHRIFEIEHVSNYVKQLLKTHSYNFLPSSVLIPQEAKKDTFLKFLGDLISDSYFFNVIKNEIYNDDTVNQLEDLTFFNIYESHDMFGGKINDFFLKQFFDLNYSWLYKCHDLKQIKYEEESYEQNIIHCVLNSQKLDLLKLNELLKIFMGGGKVIINQSDLTAPCIKKIEQFTLENELKSEKINFMAKINNTTLGEGRLVLFNGNDLSNISYDQIKKFWAKLFSTFDILHLDLKFNKQLEHFWRKRIAGPNELQFNEVRRLYLFNNSSYKKRVKISLKKHFVLSKIISEEKINIETKPMEVDVELLPEGSAVLDFGVFI